MCEFDEGVETPVTLEGRSTFSPDDHKGGDVVFQAGKGWKPEGEKIPAMDGSIRLRMADGRDALLFEPGGNIYVYDKLVDDDKEVYEKFKHWLSHARAHMGKGCRITGGVDGTRGEDSG